MGTMGGTERRRHPQRALTARTVKAAKPSASARRIAAGGGLYLFVAPGGAKSWVLRTVVKGKRCDLGLGSVALVPLAEAREQAVRLRKIARAGGDPLVERRHERRTVPTFEAAATQVHSAHAPTFKNEKHQKQWLSSLTPIRSRVTVTVGEITLICEKVPATVHGWSETSMPISSLSAPGVLIPAKTPPAEKPRAEVIVPSGIEAMWSLIAMLA